MEKTWTNLQVLQGVVVVSLMVHYIGINHLLNYQKNYNIHPLLDDITTLVYKVSGNVTRLMQVGESKVCLCVQRLPVLHHPPALMVISAATGGRHCTEVLQKVRCRYR